MSRSIQFLVNLIQQLDKSAESLFSVRVKSTSRVEGYSCVEIELTRSLELSWPVLSSCVSAIAFYQFDCLRLMQSGKELKLQDCSYTIDTLITNEVEVCFVLTTEYLPSQQSVISALHKQTIFGLPPNFYKNHSVSKILLFWGASRNPIDLAPVNGQHSLIKSKDGIEYSIVPAEHAYINFFYLNSSRELKTKHVNCANYLTEELSNRINRYKVKIKSGFDIYSFFDPVNFTLETPFFQWGELVSLVNNLAENLVQDHLRLQVAKIESRVMSVQSRRSLSFRGIHLGLVPTNELETVILCERYVSTNGGCLGISARLKILDFSPQGIDSICEFSPNSNTPLRTVPVEFEYSLRNFCDHGHDPEQVDLIICYSIRPITFPYNHFGRTYSLDETGEFARLIDLSTGNSTLVFALDRVLEEK